MGYYITVEVIYQVIANEVAVLKSQLTNHRVDLQDCTIFYQQSSLESSSIPILLLHGWGISTEPYQEVLELWYPEKFTSLILDFICQLEQY